MDTILSKACARCKLVKSFDEFYARPAYKNFDNPPTLPGHTVSECKKCMKERGTKRIHPTVPRVKTEQLAIDYLKKHGVWAAPGKSVYAADVDVVAFGCVWIEVKYAKLERGFFKFNSTPTQMKRGYRAHVVLLICDYEYEQTYHLFESDHPVFYIHDRIKSGFNFTPGAMEAKKHGNNRVVMTQPLMDTGQDYIALVWNWLRKISEELKVS